MNAPAPIDDLTSSAIRDAIAAARAGRLPDAIRIGEGALLSAGDPAALNALLGTLKCQSGDLDGGIVHLREASAARPDDTVIATNLATALAQQGRMADALAVLTETLADGDASHQLHRMRGYLAQESGAFPLAIAAYEKVVAAEPRDWESWNNLGNVRRLSGDATGGLEALDHALSLNRQSPPVRLNRALALAAVGRVDEAIADLRALAADGPGDVEPLRELYAIMKELGREEEALDAISEASRRRPGDADLAIAVAGQQLNVLRPEDAEATYRQVLNANPAHDLATLGLAVVLELSNRTEELVQLSGETARRGVGEDVRNFIRAMELRRAKRFDEGLAALGQVPERLENIRGLQLLGQLEEGAGHYERAFQAFTRMNDLQAQDLTNPLRRADEYRARLRQQGDLVGPEWMRQWRPAERDDRPSPAFIVGFPRSGTTLLDTMLMGHPGIAVLEEEPALLEAAKTFSSFAELPAASDATIGQARDTYFKVAAKRIDLAPDKLLVDKNPLSMNALPIIHRLFPDAPVILALRHPCDALFSCFASNFKLNDGMSSFLRLDSAAELYDLSFNFFEKARALLSNRVYEIRYEDVVADRERELRSLIDFLGLEWSEGVLDHEATAQTRGRVKTPSYHQIVQPIYGGSIDRWRHYERHLKPILPVLQPWIERFGYQA